MENKDKELLLERYLKDAVDRFCDDEGLNDGDWCSVQVVMPAGNDPLVVATLSPAVAPNPSQYTPSPAQRMLQGMGSVLGFLWLSSEGRSACLAQRKDAFSEMDMKWLHGTYRKPGGAEYTILGSSSGTSVTVRNNKTGKERSVPCEEVGKAIAESGVTLKNATYIPPTVSKNVMQSIKEIEYGDLYRQWMRTWWANGRGDEANIGRTFNDGKRANGTFVGGTLSNRSQNSAGKIYVKQFATGKITCVSIVGADDPRARDIVAGIPLELIKSISTIREGAEEYVLYRV